MKYFILISLFMFNILYAEENKSTEYDEINSLLTFVQTKTLSPYIAVNQKVSLRNEDLSYADLRIWLSNNGNIIQEIPIDSEGNINLPIIDEQLAKNTMLNNNQAKGSISVSLGIAVAVPEQKQVAYKDLFTLLGDTNNFMKKMAGFGSLFMPDMDVLSFKFAQPSNIVIASKKKIYTYETDEALNIDIKIKKRLMKENPQVVFSNLPTEITPID